MSYSSIRLKRQAIVLAGQSPPSSEVQDLGHGLPFIQGNAEFGQPHPVPRFECDSPPKHALPGDILISVRAPVGAINVANQRIGIGRGVAAIRALQTVDDRFLKYAVQSLLPALSSKATGTTFLAVTAQDIGDLRIPLHDLERQRRIADFLDDQVARIDNIVAAREKQANKSREEVTSTVREDLRSLSNTHHPTPLRRHVVATLTGSTPSESMDALVGIPWYTPASLTPDGQIGAPIRTIDDSGGRGDGIVRFSKGSVLMVGIGATAGRVALLDHHGAGNQQLTAILPRRGDSSGFLFRQMQVRADELLGTAPFTTLPIINNDVLRRFPVVMPRREIQDKLLRKWDNRYRTLGGIVVDTGRFTALIAELKRSLITAAVTGEFDVSASDGSRVPV